MSHNLIIDAKQRNRAPVFNSSLSFLLCKRDKMPRGCETDNLPFLNAPLKEFITKLPIKGQQSYKIQR